MNKLTTTKINFGCFATNLPNWINIDNCLRHIILSKIPGAAFLIHKIGLINDPVYLEHKKGSFLNVKYGDMTKKLKFMNKSVDFIYTSHTLEHLFPEDARQFLKECFRILNDEGVIRIIVPDLELQSRKYINNLDRFKNSNAEALNNSILYAYTAKEGQKNGHKWLYDFYYLKRVLEDCGFKRILRRNSKEGVTPDIDKLDHYEDSLIVEAFKI